MLLGVLLALAAGTIVIYVVSNYVGTTTHTVTVVVAARNIPAGTILSASPPATQTASSPYLLTTDAFQTKRVNTDFVPTDAYVYQSDDQVKTDLNDQVVIGPFFAGDILRAHDPRLAKLGTSAPGSLTLLNPAEFPVGSVLFPLPVEKVEGLVPGDHIDILVTYCVSVQANNCSGPLAAEAQTTLQNVYVYAVGTSVIDVVLTHQDALVLKYLVETGKITIVLRNPADSTQVTTTPVTSQYIINKFGFHP
jgi:Flp pilus assembly protein CpaB